MSATQRHPDILDGPEAVTYLGIEVAAGSPEGGLRALHKFAREGRIRPLRWAKSHLYHRADLDRFVAEELDRMSATDQGQDRPADDDRSGEGAA